MSALFSTPKVEKAPRPITRDEIMLDLESARRLRARKGRAANISPAVQAMLGQSTSTIGPGAGARAVASGAPAGGGA